MNTCAMCGEKTVCMFDRRNERFLCRACRDNEQRSAYRASRIGKHVYWLSFDNGYVGVTIEDMRKGWVIVRDDAGVQHRVRDHNLHDYKRY